MKHVKATVLGGGTLAVSALKILKANNVITTVITSPRHAQGDIDGAVYEDIIKEISDEVYIVESLNEKNIEDILKKTTLCLSFAAPWIFKQKHIDMCKKIYNVHLTELPKFGGGAEASWQLMSNYRRSAITIHLVNEGIDTGDILIQECIEWPEYLKTPLEIKMNNENFAKGHLEKFIKLKLDGVDLEANEQDLSERVYFPRLNTRVHGFVNWDWSKKEVCRFLQAFDEPYQGAMSRINDSDELFHLSDSKIEEINMEIHPFMKGLILRIIDTRYYIAVTDGLISLKINYSKDNRNLKPRLGDRLTNRQYDLEKALGTRIIYKP